MQIEIKNVHKKYMQGATEIPVLVDFNLQIASGQSLAILGPSGSGKTTLLGLLAGLDLPDSGDILIDGSPLSQLDEGARTRFRLENIGIIFQQFHLLPYLTAIQNVELPLEIAAKNYSASDTQTLARAALTSVGLVHREDHRPHQMSGGENQRVAFARAFVTRPKLLLADEPSGNLDKVNGALVMDLLFDLTKKNKTTLILVTHNEDIAQRADKVFRFSC
jgi:putative ABC transport system ATP-binding protein